MGKLLLEVIASVAFAFFVMCPRIAGMCAVLAKTGGLNPYLVALVGTLIASPLMALMVYLTVNFGVHAAIIAAVLTDVVAALAMGTFTVKAAVEILVIAAFIWIGVLAAKWISSLISV
ncbi:MAG: hypothetical protein DRN96_09925 [Thermoproteota archaeon]|nr:MAG: hypothetical protein DRN96_09925 [Candidatus Korarchaeota archaeon]